MTTTIAITNKWQLHIPKAARKYLEINVPGKVLIKAGAGKIVITPVKDSILSMAGKYHKAYKSKKINIEKVRDYIDYSSA